MTIKIFSFLLLIGLISCKKAEVPVNKFIGTWYDTEYIVPGRSSIKINKTVLFLIEVQAVVGGNYQKGSGE